MKPTAQQILELWNERSAIMEFEANMQRADAERKAYDDLRKLYGIFPMPDEMRKVLKNGK